MSGRNVTLQKPPRPGLSGKAFPTETLDPTKVLYRAHSSKNPPWYYASDGGGRFDIVTPNGTMYLGDDPDTCVRERLADVIMADQLVFESDADKMAVSNVHIRSSLDYANVSTNAALPWDIIRELTTWPAYGVAQEWAAWFHAEGFPGIRYATRFTLEGPNAWAIFGPAGPELSLPDTGIRIDGRKACTGAGLTIVPNTPPSRGLTKVLPPSVAAAKKLSR